MSLAWPELHGRTRSVAIFVKILFARHLSDFRENVVLAASKTTGSVRN